MKKNLLSIIAFIMAVIMIAGVLASCGGETETTSATTTAGESEQTTESSKATEEKTTESSETEPKTNETTVPTDNGTTESESLTDSNSDAATETETVTDTDSQTETETETESGTDEPEAVLKPDLSEKYGDSIVYADSLKNNVTAYYASGKREDVVFENMEMKLEYGLTAARDQQVTYLKSKNGKSYVENSIDVFVRMNDGYTYYAKNSYSEAVFNIYRFGYYYYQMRMEGQTFSTEGTVTDELSVDYKSPSGANDLKVRYKNKVLMIQVDDDANDPYFTINSSLDVDASKYTMLEITVKAEGPAANNCDLFYVAGSATGFSGEQRVDFNVATDGEFHTYRIPLYTGKDYTGTVKALRLDVNGAGASFEIKDIKFLGMDVGNAPKYLSMSRNFNIYSDKMHHVLQVAATETTENIAEFGMLTKIDASTVAKVVVKDKNGTHYDFEGIDWDSAEYVGFDIIDAGIFGYILPYDGKGGKLSVELVDGVYVIEQTMAPEGGKVIPSRTTFNEEMHYYNWVSGGNTNDFYMGQRIYTDDNHDFEEFLYEAFCERNPLTKFKVIDKSSTEAEYFGYDSLRGIYRFNMGGAPGGFSTPYYKEQNRHFRTSFFVNGDDIDRKIYVMTYTTVGQLECAVLLDEDDVMLPLSLEVGKNFSEQGGERNLYNLDDATYGEVIFPLVVKADSKTEYGVLNLYQNWGKYPLKQLSWIQFFSPYYHLSTGVTETNCILPWTFTDRAWYNTLPDHRGMSAPLWATQPQHTSAGEHDWLRYVDSEGNVVRAENVLNTIDSYGPTYADVKMDYITYDGKMKVSYTHTEMPQVDENRAYYEMTYEVLDDITINNFVTDFQFYKVDPNDGTGLYQKVGYLNENNESVVVEANQSTTPVKYVLGKDCPYFSFFDMDNHSDSNGYANLSFLVYNSEFVIGGEKAEPSFAIVNYSDTVYVTLNIEEQTTLKAGDKFTINAILLPWGSHLLDDGIIDKANNNYEYTMTLPDGTLYEDKNVRDVRKNTLKNPLTAVAGENCQVIESVFVPKVKSTNGESVEFTLTGGYNNVVVRAYGFKKMTVPVIYEKIDGEWQLYEVSSKDDEKFGHNYDGYCIHYDGDSFSYSFVTTMDGMTDRTFKIVADGNYKKWPKETFSGLEREDLLQVYADPTEIKELDGDTVLKNEFASALEVMKDEGGEYEYLRVFGGGLDAKYAEGYAIVYKPANANLGAGKYLAVKYRFGAENTEVVNRFEFYMSTETNNPGEAGCFSTNAVKSDGEWHLLIIDLEKVNQNNFSKNWVAADDGKYYPKLIRFDFFDKKMPEESYIDIAFVGIDESIENIVKLAEDVSSASMFEGSKEYKVDVTTGEVVSLYPDIPETLVQSESGYTQADLEFGAHLDYINGKTCVLMSGSSSGVVGYQLMGNAIADIDIENSATVAGHNLVLAGWCVLEGGVDRYVWSADGGKTWYDVETYGKEIDPAYQALVDAAYERTNKTVGFTIDKDGANSAFQGASGNSPTGLSCNLEEYKGQKVDVIIGAVPAKDTTTIQPLFYIGQVTVAE